MNDEHHLWEGVGRTSNVSIANKCSFLRLLIFPIICMVSLPSQASVCRCADSSKKGTFGVNKQNKIAEMSALFGPFRLIF